MKKCKCGCGTEIPDRNTFVIGHSAKWWAAQRKKNSILPGRSPEAAGEDRTKDGPLKAYQDQVIAQDSGGISFCIIKDPDPDQNKPKQHKIIKEITEELPQKEEVGDDKEVLLEDMVRTTREQEGSEPDPSVLVLPAADWIPEDRKQTGRDFTKLKAIIVLFLSIVVLVASYFYLKLDLI